MSSIQIDIPYDHLHAFCERHPIRRLALFGSVLRADFGPHSDIDMLVEFEADARITLLDMVSMELELTEIMGRKVDFRTPQELSRYFRQRVVDTAEVVYERTR